MDISYIGEHTFSGTLGRLAISASFLASLGAAVFYMLSGLNKNPKKFKVFGRWFYLGHLALLALAFCALYYLIFIHAFEYSYVNQYSSRNLPFTYLLSSLWAGQEGSFMLWALFQALLGLFLIKKAKDWEPQTLAVVSFSQFFLLMMLLGWKFSGINIGTDPFLLIRNAPAMAGNSLFNRPDYVSLLIDGQGLNPLLENIWMAIHPPLLFLGYAAALIPFSYAIAGLWKKDHSGWRRPALPWVNFAALSLGIGIILGGAWAYVSLTFGGFWAWDPVENASLVPWLFVIASLHVLLISRKKPHNMVWAYLFSVLAYVMVLYASYLTRSGVLKDSSAHAFGDEGKAFALVLYTLVFLLGGVVLLIFNHPRTKEKNKEDLTSREFWVFIGSIILVLSAFQVVLTTSIPVVNKILGTTMAPPTDSVSFYNAWQLPYGILVALLVGFAHFMKYGQSPFPEFLKKTVPSLVIGLIISVLFVFIFPFTKPVHYIFLFSLVFMLSSSVDGLINREKKQKNLGALVSHLGMSLFMLGVLITFSHLKIISGIPSRENTQMNSMTENKVLVKGDTVSMPPYKVIYKSRHEEGKWLTYTLDFLKEDGKGQLSSSFTLMPKINRNERMGNVYEPDTRHLLSRDIYGFITFAQNIGMNDLYGYSLLQQNEIGKGDTVRLEGTRVVMDAFEVKVMDPSMRNVTITARLRALTDEGEKNLAPQYVVNNQQLSLVSDSLPGKGLAFRINEVSSTEDKVKLGIYQKGSEYIVVKVTIFPYIQLLWLGTIIVFIGLFLAMRKRLRNKQPKPAETLTEEHSIPSVTQE